MRRSLRFIVAISLCLSAWALIPNSALPSEVVGWERFAEAYGLIFQDDFELGDLSKWSRTQPPQVILLEIRVEDDSFYRSDFRLRKPTVKAAGGHAIVSMAGISERDIPVFAMESRREDRDTLLRIRARRNDGSWSESPWRRLRNGYEKLEVEWRRALPGLDDGTLQVSVDGRLLLWLVDLDNDEELLRSAGMGYLNGQPVLQPVEEVDR